MCLAVLCLPFEIIFSSCVFNLSLRYYRAHGELKMVANHHIVNTWKSWKCPEHQFVGTLNWTAPREHRKSTAPLIVYRFYQLFACISALVPLWVLFSIYLHGYAILRYASTKPALAVMFLFKEFHLVDQGNQWTGGAWLRGFIGKSAVRIFVNNEISSYFSDDNCCVTVNNCVCNRAAAGQKLVSSWESVSCHYLVLSAPDGPHVGPMNLAIRVCSVSFAVTSDAICTHKLTANVIFKILHDISTELFFKFIFVIMWLFWNDRYDSILLAFSCKGS